ncbi:MAG: response regulator [Nitrospirota bacterium]|nr:MAG: response regulator [Nitrospirota bacterium]
MSKKNMLIIDDDAAIRDLLRLVFEYDGFHCWEAGNGAEGLTMIESQTFDIIILDNAMPIMTGLEFLNYLQHRSQQSDASIIMSTGSLNPEVREEATKLGAYAIVGKPFDLGEFRALVGQLCLTRHSLPQGASL